MNEQEQTYRQALAGHDWYYNYSDDYSVWRRGSDHAEKINRMREELDPDFKIWDEIAPKDFKHNK